MDRRYTTEQAAEAVNRHPVTIRKALESGELHGRQGVKGGRWSIAEPCLEAYIDGRVCPHKAAGSDVIDITRAKAPKVSVPPAPTPLGVGGTATRGGA